MKYDSLTQYSDSLLRLNENSNKKLLKNFNQQKMHPEIKCRCWSWTEVIQKSQQELLCSGLWRKGERDVDQRQPGEVQWSQTCTLWVTLLNAMQRMVIY
uniref:Uncharacterized protein n=1 Tax=Arion vulgaris TaxID=1028688 RepID=A0A0B7BZE9_9EUPU